MMIAENVCFKSTYVEEQCDIHISRYAQKSDAGNIIPAMLVTMHGSEEVVCKASFAPHHEELPKDHIMIKSWSENEGVPSALINLGIVEETDLCKDINGIKTVVYRMTESTRKVWHEYLKTAE